MTLPSQYCGIILARGFRLSDWMGEQQSASAYVWVAVHPYLIPVTIGQPITSGLTLNVGSPTVPVNDWLIAAVSGYYMSDTDGGFTVSSLVQLPQKLLELVVRLLTTPVTTRSAETK